MTEALDQAGRDALTAAGWDVSDDKAEKTFEFKNFVQAFGWMTQAAIHAQVMNHHPEWSNVYNKVEVTLTTHDVDGLSPLDIELAGRMDKISQ